jgi:hypothetical protein
VPYINLWSDERYSVRMERRLIVLRYEDGKAREVTELGERCEALERAVKSLCVDLRAERSRT